MFGLRSLCAAHAQNHKRSSYLFDFTAGLYARALLVAELVPSCYLLRLQEIDPVTLVVTIYAWCEQNMIEA